MTNKKIRSIWDHSTENSIFLKITWKTMVQFNGLYIFYKKIMKKRANVSQQQKQEEVGRRVNNIIFKKKKPPLRMGGQKQRTCQKRHTPNPVSQGVAFKLGKNATSWWLRWWAGRIWASGECWKIISREFFITAICDVLKQCIILYLYVCVCVWGFSEKIRNARIFFFQGNARQEF